LDVLLAQELFSQARISGQVVGGGKITVKRNADYIRMEVINYEHTKIESPGGTGS
jgi:hypothetical protein